ncbi:hypothetical protein BDQ12DRAFT_654525 [Crucibulum laeve]|uniref:NB-ARC domain-containing protein n=1 Tax=Crucibulum laeve TaxID=68775 RepID=A0A5C3LV31_9AGAR|nr:hypothetical protein BDQ12DRAFT_654525 [Crucibulum laeve]
MGRLPVPTRPSGSAAVFLYGGNRRRGKARWQAARKPDDQVQSNLKASLHTSSKSSTTSSLSSSTSESSSKNIDASNSFSYESPLSELSNKPPARDTSAPSSAPSNALRLLSILKDVSEMFNGVPYVKAVTGIVSQILEIIKEVQSNKSRCQELVDKLISYSRVVFVALLKFKNQSGCDLSDLKEDLLEITSVFESIYEILKALSASTTSSKITRVLRREDIQGQIEEQSRRLDTTITSFQLKSAIVLRVQKDSQAHDKNEPSDGLPTRRLTPKGLRSKPKMVVGREKEIGDIVDIILGVGDSPPRLAILGPGGIGKTSLALSVLHEGRIRQKYGDARLFIPCEATSSIDLLLMEIAHVLDIPVTARESSAQLLTVILRHLCQKPHLLLFDNFETPWDSHQTRSDVEALITELDSIPSLAVLITLRGSQHPSGMSWSKLLPPLQPLDLESAKCIFSSISKKMNEEAINLIQAVDRIPLAVTLLANLAAVDGETTEALWLRWQEERISMVESGQDRLTNLESSIRISIHSPRMQRDAGSLQFLSVLSMLPDGMSESIRLACVKGFPAHFNVNKSISTLRQNALLFEDSNHVLRVLSPIRLFMIDNYPPSQEWRDFLQAHYLSVILDDEANRDTRFNKQLTSDAGNIDAMLIDCLKSGRPLADIVEAVLVFCQHIYSTGIGSAQCIALAVDRLQATQDVSSQLAMKSPPGKIKRFSLFGAFPLRKMPSAQKKVVLEQSVDPFLKLHADCYGCWGQLLSRQWKHTEAEKLFQAALVLHIKARDQSGQAYDLHNLACLLSRQTHSSDAAERNFLEAITLHRADGDVIGEAYDIMGIGHIKLQKSALEDAEAIFLEALKLFSDIGDNSGQASAFNNLGKTMQYFSKFCDSESYFSRGLKLYTDLEDSFGQSESLVGLASSFLLRSKFCEAREFLEKAMALRSPYIDPDHLHILGRICIAETNFADATKHLLTAKELHSTLGNHLGIADDLHYLASVEFYSGNMQDALVKKEESMNLYKAHGNKLGMADSLTWEGMFLIRRSGSLTDVDSKLQAALQLHTELRSSLGQAVDYYHIGTMFLQDELYEKAMTAFDQALQLHTSIENAQGQADDLTKISEVLLRVGELNEAAIKLSDALALHIEISDSAGQGDDLYMQACIYLEQAALNDLHLETEDEYTTNDCMIMDTIPDFDPALPVNSSSRVFYLENAENALREALVLHKRAGVVFGEAKDLGTLASVIFELWKARDNESWDSEEVHEAYKVLDAAIAIFHRLGATKEVRMCGYHWDVMDDY